MHKIDAKSLIGARGGRCYLLVSREAGPNPRGRREAEEPKPMSAAALRRMIDRIAPLCLTTLMFGLVATFAAVGLVGV